MKILNERSKVKDLMIEELKCWNVDLVYEIFERDETVKICSIPLSRREVEDKAIWGHTKDVMFSVRSAYHLGIRMDNKHKGEPSNYQEQKSMWQRLWKLNVTGSTKQFHWIALIAILPTKQMLFNKKITEDEICSIYCKNVESISHVLCSCPATIDVWA